MNMHKHCTSFEVQQEGNGNPPCVQEIPALDCASSSLITLDLSKLTGSRYREAYQIASLKQSFRHFSYLCFRQILSGSIGTIMLMRSDWTGPLVTLPAHKLVQTHTIVLCPDVE